MPEAKRKHSPVTGNVKPSKHVINADKEPQVAATPDISEEIRTPPVEATPKEEPTPPSPPIDVMKNEPILLPIIVDTYSGDVDENGFYHGHGVSILKGGLTYNGSFERGKMHGEGTLTWPNGTTFTGTLYQNEISGKGLYLWPDGSSYKGETKKGIRHGYGLFKCADGIKSYDGNWLDGKRNGNGVLYYDAIGASYYDGEWKDNQKNSFGLRRFRNGNIYQGHWMDNIREGEGTMKWFDLRQEYRGNWTDGLQDGHGENTWYFKRVKSTQYPLRNYYVGNFFKGERHGSGVFHYASGAQYEGEWKSNLKHGRGTFIFKNGYSYSGQFRNDHMVDFPELILSGMATPDIGRMGIPVQSPSADPTSLRTNSIIGIPTKGTDIFLDIDIEELLMDFSYDLEQRQNEVDNILRLLMRHASHLKSLYKVYSYVGQLPSVDKTTAMSKLQYFRFLKDYGVHRLGSSVMEMEKMLGEDIGAEGYHRKRIFFRDFLNSLIRISYHLFKETESTTEPADDGVHNVVSACFKQFLQCLLVPPETVQIKGFFFTTVEKCQEVMKHVDLFMDMYAHFRELYVKDSSEYTMKQRHLVFMYDDLRLLSSTGKDDGGEGKLTAAQLVEIVTKEDRDEDGFFNMELLVSPLEFIETIVATSAVYVTKEILRKHDVDDHDSGLTGFATQKGDEQQEGKGSVGTTTADRNIVEGGEEQKDASLLIEPTTTDTLSGESSTAVPPPPTVEIHSPKLSFHNSNNSATKLASKSSKKNRPKIDKDNSKEHALQSSSSSLQQQQQAPPPASTTSRKERQRGGEEKKMNTRPPTEDTKSVAKRRVSIEASPPPHPNGVNEYGTGLKEIPENHSTSKNAEEQNSNPEFNPPNESNITTSSTTTSGSSQTDNTNTADAMVSAQNAALLSDISFDQFNTWRVKLDLFVEQYLRPAYERGLPNAVDDADNKPLDVNKPAYYVSMPTQATVEIVE